MKNKLTLLLLALTLISCSTRKVEASKQTVKEEVTQTAKEETKTETNENVKVIDSSTAYEVEFIPIDSNKPIIVNGKSYLNVRIKHLKRKNNITTISTKKVAQIEKKEGKTNVKREVKVKDKVTQRESVPMWWLWILILGIAYLGYRKLRRMNVI